LNATGSETPPSLGTWHWALGTKHKKQLQMLGEVSDFVGTISNLA